MNKKNVLIISLILVIISVGIFSFLSNNVSQKNDQMGISENISIKKITPISTSTTPKKLNISISESVGLSSK